MGTHAPSPALRTGARVSALARAIVAVVPFALFLRAFVVAPIYIPSASMEPTLLAGDRVLVDRQLFGGSGVAALDRWLPVRNPRRGDVLWVVSPLSPDERLVKRCVATPGDRFADAPVPPGRLALLGDHRSDSLDSRVFGLVPRPSVRGRIALVLWSAAPDGKPQWRRTLSLVR